MVTLDQLVLSDHIYCKFKDLWDLSIIESELEEIEINSDHKGFGIFRLFIRTYAKTNSLAGDLSCCTK